MRGAFGVQHARAEGDVSGRIISAVVDTAVEEIMPPMKGMDADGIAVEITIAQKQRVILVVVKRPEGSQWAKSRVGIWMMSPC